MVYLNVILISKPCLDQFLEKSLFDIAGIIEHDNCTDSDKTTYSYADGIGTNSSNCITVMC